LGDFNAFQNKKNKVTIEWATLSEINNSHFHIERSIDLKKWTVIGKVEGNGTTKNALDYTTTDQNPYKGINYYRLTQYAYNNDKETFRSVAVNYKSSARGHDIYPNPVKKKLHISINNTDGLQAIKIYNTYGSLVYSITNIEENNYTLDLSNISKGLHVLNFQYEDELIREKFIRE